MWKYLIVFLLGCMICFTVLNMYNRFWDGAYITRKDFDKDGIKEMCLQVQQGKTYILTWDNNRDITGLAEYQGLEIKLGTPVPVKN